MRNQFLTVTLPIGLAVVGASAIISHGQNSRYGVPIMAPADARTPIHESDMPLVIDEPGSYYFAENIMTGECGITIASDNVTIDLNGFSLAHDTVSVCTGPAIATDADRNNIRILNGAVSGWLGGGIDLDGSNHLVRDVMVESNQGNAIDVGRNSLVKCCQVLRNSGVGIRTGKNSGVRECLVADNGNDGLSMDRGGFAVECAVMNNAIAGLLGPSGGVVFACSGQESGSVGVAVAGGAMLACSGSNNGSDGLVGINGTTILGGTAAFNGAAGIRAEDGTVVYGCVASRNDENGIEAASGCRIRESVSWFNDAGDPGSFYGIEATGTNNLIESNTAFGSNAGFGGTIRAGSKNTLLHNFSAGLTGPALYGEPVSTSLQIQAAANAALQVLVANP